MGNELTNIMTAEDYVNAGTVKIQNDTVGTAWSTITLDDTAFQIRIKSPSLTNEGEVDEYGNQLNDEIYFRTSASASETTEIRTILTGDQLILNPVQTTTFQLKGSGSAIYYEVTYWISNT